MISKKQAAIVVAVGAYIGLLLSDIYVPDNFESPYLYKFIYSYLSFTGFVARSCAFFNYGIEASNIRSVAGFLTRLIKTSDDNVKEVDMLIEGVKVRLYTSRNTEPSIDKSIMVYFHGGGYAIGDLETYDAYLQEFVKRLNMVVISVDYRMSPEHPYPTPTEDCYEVSKHVLSNAEKYGANTNKVILAGDSAGGNAAAIISQRLLKEKSKLPIIQVLIYPWTQLANQRLPSFYKYQDTFVLNGAQITFNKFVSWYMGITNITEEIENVLASNEHFLLLDADQRSKIISHLDYNKIPQSYKKDRDYYEASQVQNKFIYPNKNQLDEKSILKRDKDLANKLRQVFKPEISPLFADTKSLTGLPKTYMLVLEWDMLKDENLLYAERLREANVPIKIAFYENAFHTIISLIKPTLGFQKARDMQTDLINYLKSNV